MKKKVLCLSIILLLGVVVYFAVQLKNARTNFVSDDITISEYTRKQLAIEEFSIVEGMWEVSEYMGMAVEVAINEEILEEDKKEETEYVDCITNEYLGKVLMIKINNIDIMSPSSELGYHINDSDDLFFIFRQPADLDIRPPYTCIFIKLRDEQDAFNIIIDSDNKTTLCIKSHFFRLNRIKNRLCWQTLRIPPTSRIQNQENMNFFL